MRLSKLATLLASLVFFAGAAACTSMDSFMSAGDERADDLSGHAFIDADSLDGIAGTYLVDQVTPGSRGTLAIELTVVEDGVRKNGSYRRKLIEGTEVESGNFSALPTNPAIGFAHLLLMPPEDASAPPSSDPSLQAPSWMIEKIALSADGSIEAMMMLDFDMSTPPSSPEAFEAMKFVLHRTDTDVFAGQEPESY